MIPTVILFGLVFGHWWRGALVAGTVGWPALLLATGTLASGGAMTAAAALALVNVGVGILLWQAGAWGLRRVRHSNAVVRHERA